MTLDIMFLLLFFLNAIVISLHFPRRIIRTSLDAIEKYPPHEFPKLYAGWTVDNWYQFIARYRGITSIITAIGLVIVAALSVMGLPELRLTILIFSAFVAVQTGCNVWRLGMMKKSLAALQMDDIATHTAELRPRSVLDCLSKLHKIAVVISVLICSYFIVQLAIQLSPGTALGLAVFTLMVSILFTINANKVVRGEVEIMQAMLPQGRNTVIKRAVVTAADTIIRLNLSTGLIAFFVATSNWYLLPIVVSGAVLANTSYEFFRELQIKAEDVFDMDRFKSSSAA